MSEDGRLDAFARRLAELKLGRSISTREDIDARLDALKATIRASLAAKVAERATRVAIAPRYDDVVYLDGVAWLDSLAESDGYCP